MDLALEDAGAHGGSGPWEDLRDVPASYLDSGGDFLVGFVDGELVAMGGLLRLSPGEAEIRRMRVHPNFQRQGLGRLLLERLEERAQARGCETIRLDTRDEQTAARRLYERSGYRETGRRQGPPKATTRVELRLFVACGVANVEQLAPLHPLLGIGAAQAGLIQFELDPGDLGDHDPSAEPASSKVNLPGPAPTSSTRQLIPGSGTHRNHRELLR